MDKSGKRFTGIGFGMAKHLERIKSQTPFKIFYNVDMNEYLGEKKLQLKIRDIEF
jgi:single-stranded-DNA-specific exonuclease